MAETKYSSRNKRVSADNLAWLERQERVRLAKNFNKGVYTPSISHMQLYGRKEEPSKFERAGLWITRNLHG
jgi:hypothetical protein